MSTDQKAVFLSYASQDAEAAEKICEALRQAGIEVWFDKNELVGGDAWDRKIRDQISTCTFFVPIISANTQARQEGYFRLEWKLAAQRTYMMSERTAFLLPVVVDDTHDSEADVPSEYKAVQWTRLPGGETSPTFAEHVKALLSEDESLGGASVRSEKRETRSERGGGSGREVSPTAIGRKRSPAFVIGIAAAVVIGIGLVVWWNSRTSNETATTGESLAEAATDTVSEKSIAILPFENRSANADDAFFTDGIHDDLLTQVSRIQDIKTIGRSSVMGYRESTKRLAQIGEELGVATVLQGGVQRAGNQVRINVQLSDCATDDHLWAESYTRELTAENIFEIQTEIAVAVTEALQAVLSPTEQQQLGTLPTENLAALEAYFRGKQELEKYTSASMVAAIPFFEEAIRLDPDYAEAYAGLARVVSHQNYFGGLPLDELMAEAKPLIDKALELNPNLSEAWVELGRYEQWRKRWDLAEEAFSRAIELGPNNGDAYKGYSSLLQWQRGDNAKALEVLRKGVEVDPLDFGAINMLASALILNFEREEARSILDKTLQADREQTTALRTFGQLQALSFHRHDLAIKSYLEALAVDPGLNHVFDSVAWEFFSLGEIEKWWIWKSAYMALLGASDEERLMWEAYRAFRRWEDDRVPEILSPIGEESDYFLMCSYLRFRVTNDGAHRRELVARLEAAVPELTDGSPVTAQQLYFRYFFHAEMLLRLGETEDAQHQVRRILAGIPQSPQARWQVAPDIVSAYAFIGDKTRAVEELRWYVEKDGAFLYLPGERHGWGEITYEILENEPGFLELVAIMDERIAEQRANVERWEANGELASIPEPPDTE